MSFLSKYAQFSNGKKRPSGTGPYPVYGGNGILGYADDYNMENGIIVGRVGVYCGSVFLEKGRCWVSDNAIKAESTDDSNLEFMYYLLKSLKLNERRIGTSQPLLTQGILNSIEVDIPDITCQERIASILESIDEKIKNNKEINDNLLQQASAIFDNALHQSDAVSYTDLGALGDVKGGKRLPKGINLISEPNSHPYIRVRDLNNVVFASLSNDYEYVDDETQKTISRYIANAGDVLISIVGTIGLTAIVDKSLDNANLTENCVKVTNLNGISPEYLLLYLRSNAGIEAIAKGTVGAVQLKLPIKNIQAIPVPILPDSDAEQLNGLLRTIFIQIAENVTESKCLAEIRDALLPKLMSGELNVSELDL